MKRLALLGWLVGCGAPIPQEPPSLPHRPPDARVAGASLDLPDPVDTAQPELPVDTDVVSPNILFLLVDDAGLDKIGVYDVTQSAPDTPEIDALAARGVRFEQVWAAPTCSPSRATLLTGRHPYRHGIGRWIDARGDATALAGSETTLPELLARAPTPYTSAVAGKWHLAGFSSPQVALHPLRAGFAHHRGSLANPGSATHNDPPAPRGYFSWQKSVDGVVGPSSTYMTTDTVDETVEFTRSLPEPWFILAAFNAPHVPVHVPPAPLPGSLLDGSTASHADLVDASVEALDAEIGRLLAEVDEELLARTVVFFASDNGTAGAAVRPPLDPDRSKGTVYEGGVRVPLIAFGPGVDAAPGSVVVEPVTLADLLPTLAELAGVPRAAWVDSFGAPLVLDGVSLRPLLADPSASWSERALWTESFYPAGPPPQDELRWAVQRGRYKLAEEPPGRLRFFDLDGRPFDEGPDLLEAGLTPTQEAAISDLEVDRDGFLRAAGRIP